MRSLLLLLVFSGCKRSDEVCVRDDALLCEGTRALTCKQGLVTHDVVCGDAEVCVPDAGCEPCEPVLVGVTSRTVLDDAAVVEGTLGWRRLRWPSFELVAAGDGPVRVEADEGVVLYDAEGPLSLPAEVSPGVVLSVQPLALGEWTLTASREGCGAASQTIEVRQLPGLAGRTLSGYPHFEFVDAFDFSDSVQAALDPSRFPERVGERADVYVVAHRDPASWVDDPALVDVADGPLTTRIVTGSVADNVVDLWLSDLPNGPEVIQSFDVVYDFDRDGLLGPNDLMDGFAVPGFSVLADLTAPGPHPTTFRNLSKSTWITQRIYLPDDLDSFEQPAPLVVLSHGNGHDYTWYDDLGFHLASWGFVMMAHRNNTDPGITTAAKTTVDNTDFLVDAANRLQPMKGHVDTHRIMWVGHSRGAEGVAYAYRALVDGELTADTLVPSDIKVISSIAPTVFNDPWVSSPGDRPFHILHGTADGDVTGGVSQLGGFGCGLCQSMRLLQSGRSDLATTVVQGATHNDFNCCGFNDGAGVDAPKIGREEAQRVSRAWHLALAEHYLHQTPDVIEVLERMPERFRPSAVSAVLSTTRRPAAGLVVLDDFQSEPSPTVASSGGAVTATVEHLVEGFLDDRNNSFTWSESDPMNGMTQAHFDGPRAARGVVFDWSGEAKWSLAVPQDLRDFTGADTRLAFRVCQGTRHPITDALAAPLHFTVALVDRDGVESAIDFGVFGSVPRPYPRGGSGAGKGWANEFTTVRMRTADFEADGSGVDLSHIAKVELRFGSDYGSPQGRIGLDDLVLERR